MKPAGDGLKSDSALRRLLTSAIIIIIIIIIIIHKTEKTCSLIDVAIPADRNVVQKEAEKKLKYKSLCIEIQRMWDLKCTIIPIVMRQY